MIKINLTIEKMNKKLFELETKIQEIQKHIINLNSLYNEKNNLNKKIIKSNNYKNLKVNPEIYETFNQGMNIILNEFKVIFLKNLPDFFPTIGNSTIHRYFKIYLSKNKNIEVVRISKLTTKAIFKIENKEYFEKHIDKICEKPDFIANNIEIIAKKLCKENISFTIDDIMPKVSRFCAIGKVRKVLNNIDWLGKSQDSNDFKKITYFDISKEKEKREELKKLCVNRIKSDIENKKLEEQKINNKSKIIFKDINQEVWKYVESFSYYEINDKLESILQFALYHPKGFNLNVWNKGMLHKIITYKQFNDFCNEIIINQKKILKILNLKGKFILNKELFKFKVD